MANEDAGEIKCGWCSNTAAVRRASTGKRKFYVMCPTCGQQWLNTAGGQSIIMERATIYGAEGKPQPVTERPEKIETVKPVTAAPPPKPVNEKKRGFDPLAGFM